MLSCQNYKSPIPVDPMLKKIVGVWLYLLDKRPTQSK